MADIALDVLCIDTSVHVVNHTPAQSVTGCGSEPIGERRHHPCHYTANIAESGSLRHGQPHTDEDNGVDGLTRLPAARRPARGGNSESQDRHTALNAGQWDNAGLS